MLLKQKVKYAYKDHEGITRHCTVQYCGRTEEELFGRIDKDMARRLDRGFTLR